MKFELKVTYAGGETVTSVVSLEDLQYKTIGLVASDSWKAGDTFTVVCIG